MWLLLIRKYLCIVILLLCIGNKNTDTLITDSLSIYDNHPTLDISEAKHLQWVDSVLGVKGVKLIDYRNRIYQYNDTRFYWNRTFGYFLVYPSSFTHGEESDLSNGNHFVNEDSTICLNVYATYFDVFNTEIEQGNRIVKKDITDHSYTIEGNTKGDRYFYSKAICKKAYEREIIVTVKLEYTRSVKKQAEEIVDNNIHLYNLPRE